MRVYVITLHKHEDLNNFYEDMETPGGALFIPDRAIPVDTRRPVSRNTHYKLTDEEAALIRNDSRVMAVELSIEEAGLQFKPSWIQSSLFWNRSDSISSTHKNWGLLRSVEGVQRVGWGSNSAVNNVSGTINVTASGKNVDVVVVDGHMNPSHPEFAVNVDGTGGTRVNQYNWFELSEEVTGSIVENGTYVYAPYVDPSYPDEAGDGYSDRTVDNDHGAHVAGIIAGNTQGWAHDVNIYNISPYASSPSPTIDFLDYIRVWHRNKEINPITGVKNPTITNHSYGLYALVNITTITTIRYRGTFINGPFTISLLFNYGIVNGSGLAFVNMRNVSVEQDLIDLMSEGVIAIGSAGNLYSKIANESGSISDDYNNYFVADGTIYYYMRGTITAAAGVICVGAISALTNDSKLTSSNCGPRVDVYAPGEFIASSVNSNIGEFSNDTRNTSYYISKKSGTSMSAPQATGILTCLAETWPRINQEQALIYIQQHSALNQITASIGGFTDLQGSANRYLTYYRERPATGEVGPKTNQGNRPTSGQTWPRPKIFRYGR